MWGKADDAKLPELFRTPHDDADPNELEIAAVKAVHKKCFSQFKCKNFAPLHRGKARSFQVSKTLDGHRKSECGSWICCPRFDLMPTSSSSGSAAAKEAVEQTDIDNSNSDSGDSDFGSEDEAEEDIELDQSFFAVDNDNGEGGEEEAMPPLSARKRTPRKPASAVDDVTASLNGMSLSSTCCMGFTFPYLISTCADDVDVMCKVEFFTHMLPRECFHPDTADQGHSLELHTRAPDFFVDEERIMNQKHGYKDFNINTSEAQACKNTCESIANANDKGIVFGCPQRIMLPFRCETRIVEWEIQAYSNDLVAQELVEEDGKDGPEQYHGVLVTIPQKLRSKRKTEGGFRKVAPPPPDDDLQDE